ncbi:transposase [Natronospirillum operosum]|uniref:Transposase n=1 Tax=Natronospirillum operosum TaxID=2759953 RepID=A0A4Z0WIM7_9GAMM|nr:transposase [Natronospirillum operosum]TGG95283.1 transposase [Natronospirillum operosum]
MPHSNRLRQYRTSLHGHFYHVVTSTRNREPVFSNLAAARQCIQTMQDEDQSGSTRTYAYCLMPDHLHWLFQLQGESLSKVVRRVKAKTSLKVGQPLWQSGYYDHVIRAEESMIEIARYIIANPKRAGLTRSVRDFSHWDCIWI